MVMVIMIEVDTERGARRGCHDCGREVLHDVERETRVTMLDDGVGVG